jgi:hypothetical protein
MGHTAGAMVAANHPDSHAIATKQQQIQQQLRTLHRLASSRQRRLMESMYRHEYFLESADLEQWIREQVLTAASEDFGQDYEHLLVSGLSVLLVQFSSYSNKINTANGQGCRQHVRQMMCNIRESLIVHVFLYAYCSVSRYPNGSMHINLHTHCGVFRYPIGYMLVYIHTHCGVFRYPCCSMHIYLHMH